MSDPRNQTIIRGITGRIYVEDINTSQLKYIISHSLKINDSTRVLSEINSNADILIRLGELEN